MSSIPRDGDLEHGGQKGRALSLGLIPHRRCLGRTWRRIRGSKKTRPMRTRSCNSMSFSISFRGFPMERRVAQMRKNQLSVTSCQWLVVGSPCMCPAVQLRCRTSIVYREPLCACNRKTITDALVPGLRITIPAYPQMVPQQPHLSSIICYLLSIICYLLSVICYLVNMSRVRRVGVGEAAVLQFERTVLEEDFNRAVLRSVGWHLEDDAVERVGVDVAG